MIGRIIQNKRGACKLLYSPWKLSPRSGSKNFDYTIQNLGVASPDPDSRAAHGGRRCAYWAFRLVKHTALMRWDRCLAKIVERQAAWEGRCDARA